MDSELEEELDMCGGTNEEFSDVDNLYSQHDSESEMEYLSETEDEDEFHESFFIGRDNESNTKV